MRLKTDLTAKNALLLPEKGLYIGKHYDNAPDALSTNNSPSRM